MRISTANALDRSLEQMQQRQQSLTDAQERLTSGKRVARASDDPTAAARAERALAQQSRVDASQRALEASRNAMSQSESALGNAGELMQRARELVLQAGSPTYNDDQRLTLSKAIRGLRDQLLQVANRGDGAGGFLFGGQGAATPPFVDAPGGVQFRGTAGNLQAASGEPLPMTVDGGMSFLSSMSGNGVFVTAPVAGNGSGGWVDAGRVTDPTALTGDAYQVVFSVAPGGTTYALLRNGAATAVTAAPYVSGQAIEFDGMSLTVTGTPANGDRFDATPSARDLSLFDTLDHVADELAVSGRSAAQVTQTVQRGLRDVDATLGTLISVRSQLGEVLGRTDAVESRLAESKLAAQTERSAAEDLDMISAVSDFQNRQTSYDAALKAYSMVQRLSLFQYIS
jgi:flagellar hook-associated protein 3 FlgL